MSRRHAGQPRVCRFRCGALEHRLRRRLAIDPAVNDGNVGLTLRLNHVGVNLGPARRATRSRARDRGDAATTTAVALIENVAGFNADVLALRVAGQPADGNNNFITFFDLGAIGRIEQGSTTAADPGSAGTFLRLISGGADFAECLPRAEGVAVIGPGRIVGVKGGRVSLATAGAEGASGHHRPCRGCRQRPAVAAGRSRQSLMVGQVRGRVAGPVAAGTFILPSGFGDGDGRAVAPRSALMPCDLGQVVGRAWGRPGAAGPVTVAVGVQGADPPGGRRRGDRCAGGAPDGTPAGARGVSRAAGARVTVDGRPRLAIRRLTLGIRRAGRGGRGREAGRNAAPSSVSPRGGLNGCLSRVRADRSPDDPPPGGCAGSTTERLG